MANLTVLQRLVILLVVWHLFSGGLPAVATKPTAVVYTYEKDASPVPSPVAAAINQLNRQGIKATHDEVDTTDGTGDPPDQYQVSRPAAVASGLPALVVLSHDKVLKVVKDPKTLEAVLEAAQ